MRFRKQLEKLDTCPSSLEWIGNRTIEEAWKTCENSNWMLWFLSKTDLDLIDPICDIAERVLHLVPEKYQLAYIWAFDAARRRAPKDELAAAAYAAYAAAYAKDINTYFPSAYASSAITNVIAYVIARTNESDALLYSINDFDYAIASVNEAARAYVYAYSFDFIEESKNHCDIIRKHFTIKQVRGAFKKLVA